MYIQAAAPQPQQPQFVPVPSQPSYTISSTHPSITSITQAPPTAVYGYEQALQRGHIVLDSRHPLSVQSEGNVSFTLTMKVQFASLVSQPIHTT